MAKRTDLPDTSLHAYKAIHPDMLALHYKKIIEALKVLGTSNYENIANQATMDRHAIARRLKELEKLGLIYKPGTKSNTKSGRQAYDYCLVGVGLPRTDNEVKYKAGEHTAADYANQIIASSTKPSSVQPKLF